jgi:hypothetical protein
MRTEQNKFLGHDADAVIGDHRNTKQPIAAEIHDRQEDDQRHHDPQNSP